MTDREIVLLMIEERKAHRVYSKLAAKAYFEPSEEIKTEREVSQARWKQLHKQLAKALDVVEKSL